MKKTKTTSKMGDWLRKFRIEQGMTAGEMADVLQISRPYLTQIESGDKKFPESRLFDVSDLFNVNYAMLVELYENAERVPFITNRGKKAVTPKQPKQPKHVNLLNMINVDNETQIVFDRECEKMTLMKDDVEPVTLKFSEEDSKRIYEFLII